MVMPTAPSASPSAPEHSPARVRPRLAVPAILLAHAALVAVLASRLNVWLDEAFSLETTSAGLGVAFRRAIDFEMQPPAYFTLLAAWRSMAGGYIFARILSILCAVCALALVARLWRRLCPRVHSGWVVAVLAFHPFTVYAAVEIRLYALALLLSVLLLDLFFATYFTDEGGPRAQRIEFTAASVAALWTQFYLGFLLAMLGGVLVLMRRWRSVARYLVAMLVTAVALAPFVPGVTGQLAGHNHTLNEPFGLVEQVKFVYQRLAYYVLPRETESPRAIKLARDAVVAAGLVGLGARFAATRPRPRLSAATWTLGVVAAGLMACFVVAVYFTRTQDLVLVRHTVAVFVPVVVTTLLIAADTGGRRAVAATALVILAFEAADLATVYLPHPAKRGDWLAVARYIETHEKPGEPILVFRAPTELPLAIHYHGRNPIVPVPRANDRDHWVLEDAQLHSEAEVSEFMDTLPGRPREIWLVTDTIWSTMGVSFGHDILDRALAKSFDVKDERSFFASRVRLLERR